MSTGKSVWLKRSDGKGVGAWSRGGHSRLGRILPAVLAGFWVFVLKVMGSHHVFGAGRYNAVISVCTDVSQAALWGSGKSRTGPPAREN